MCSTSACDSWQTRRAMTGWSILQPQLCDRQVAVTATQRPAACMHACRALPWSPRQDLVLAVLPPQQSAHFCTLSMLCTSPAGHVLAQLSPCQRLLACCSWPSWPALPTEATRLQAVALVFDHVLLAAPPSAEATRAASSPSEAGQEQVVSVPSSPASLQLSLSDRLSSLERARSTGSPRLGGAVNAALKLLEDLCMMATGQAPCSSSFC